MQIPKSIVVNGILYQIKLVEQPLGDDNEPTWGLVRFEKAEILIKKSLDENHLEQTFFHELVHIMLWECGNDDELVNNETLVSSLSNQMYQVFKVNKGEVVNE